MKLSLSNGVFSKLSLEENFATVRRLGFENVEFNMKTVKKENDTAVYAAERLLAASGLKCLTLHSATLHVNDEVEVHRAVYYGKISLEFARRLKAPIMTVHSNVSKRLPRSVREKCVALMFGELKPFARSLGVKLALENLSYTSTGFGKNVEQLEEVLNIMDDDSVGVTFDFCHSLETGQTENLLEKYGNLLSNVHMADKSHKPFTEPIKELTSFLAKLDEFGYDGPITLEIARNTPTEEIAKSRALFDKLLRK